MKSLKILSLSLMSAIMLSSCLVDDDVQELEGAFASTPYVVGFKNNTSNPFFLTNGETQIHSESVSFFGGKEFANNPSVDVTFEIDPSSTAVAGTDFDFENSNQTMTIPANRDFGTLNINIYTDNIDVDNPKILVLNLISSSNGVVASGFETKEITINGICVSDIAGMYSVTTTYGYHDFLPDYNPHTMDIEIVEVSSGIYSVFDMSGGLYSSGPYASAYNTGNTSFDVIFTENCGEISWTNQVDPWGDVIPLANGVNAVDENTGVITISWYCTAYGENGVSVYTPL